MMVVMSAYLPPIHKATRRGVGGILGSFQVLVWDDRAGMAHVYGWGCGGWS